MRRIGYFSISVIFGVACSAAARSYGGTDDPVISSLQMMCVVLTAKGYWYFFDKAMP